MSPPPEIRRGRSNDLAGLSALLEQAGLPSTDLASASDLQLWLLEVADSPAGIIALERFGTVALLRSLAVTPQYRKRGFGQLLVERLEADARAEGVAQLVLLTQTAEAFFRRRGYVVIDRGAAAEAVKQSAQFRSLCPASAVCMAKTLIEQSGVTHAA
jgi:amino-acid N-acetyltransferase